MVKLCNAVVLLVSYAITTPILAQQAQPIGRVIATQGQVIAIGVQGNQRQLRRRSEVFAGDTIVTGGQGGSAQIRMTDSAMITLGEDTEFVFAAYVFDGQQGSPDIAKLSLVRGRFRTLTGMIGDNPDDDYRLDTQAASISQDDAVYECSIESGKLLCGVFAGSITLTNALSEVRLGLGGDYDFAEVPISAAPVVPLMSMPAALGQLATGTFPTGRLPAGVNGSALSVDDAGGSSVDGSIQPNPPNNSNGFPAPQAIQVTPYKQ